MEEECRDLHAAQQSRQAEEVCRAAVDLVERFPPDRVHTRVGAYENLGYVLLDQRKFPESIDYFKRAATLAEKPFHRDDIELGIAYSALALALHESGDLKGGREYYERSIKKIVLARLHAPTDELKTSLAGAEKNVLQNYAKLLRQSGDESAVEEAEKRAEAIK